MKVLVCGARDYTQAKTIFAWLDGLYAAYGDSLIIINGGAKGADSFAREWAQDRMSHLTSLNGNNLITVKADWDKHNKGAGPIRNQKMLDDHNPDLVLAFKNGFDWEMKKGGTEDMVKRSMDANIPAYVIQKAEPLEAF